MKRQSNENIWIPVVGAAGWQLAAPGLDVSIDGGTTWVAASVATTTAQPARLSSGVVGTKCNVYVLSSALNIPASAESIDVLVRITTTDEVAVVEAGSISIE